MPLIDVIFLLLTFFIYAMVLMVRVDVLPVPLASFTAGEAAEPRPVAAITIDLDGQLFVNREPVALDEVLPALQAIREAEPQTAIYLALESGEGRVDRAPLLQQLWDRLKDAGMEIAFVGAPGDTGGSAGGNAGGDG